MAAPGDDAPMGQPGGGERRSSIWPSIYPRVLDLILQHRSTIIFCNARRAAERLAAKLNELYDESLERDADGAPIRLTSAKAVGARSSTTATPSPTPSRPRPSIGSHTARRWRSG